jgi:hypothetical protein
MEGRVFTPPKLTPLNLDLSSLSGGGALPAQYEGETHDQCAVYCRYRGGWLSVTVANSPEADVFADGTCLLDERIGPPLDGRLSLGQLCLYAGITIRGKLPPHADDDDGPYKDLSGATTFCDAWLDSTLETAQELVDRLTTLIPDTCIVQPLFESHNMIGARLCTSAADISSSQFYLVPGTRPSKEQLAAVVSYARSGTFSQKRRSSQYPSGALEGKCSATLGGIISKRQSAGNFVLPGRRATAFIKAFRCGHRLARATNAGGRSLPPSMRP